MKIRTWFALAGAASVASAQALGASTDLTFFRVTSSGAPNIAGQISLTVSTVQGDPGKVDFTLRNTAAIASSIDQVFFEDGALLGPVSLVQSGTGFVTGSGNLPGASTLDPLFTATRGYRTGVTVLSDLGPSNGPGLDRAGDWLTFRFGLQGGATYDDVLMAMAMRAGAFGTLRIGVVGDAIGGGTRSDSFVNTPVTVPLPPAVWAGTAGLATVLGAGRVRRRRSS